MTQVFLGIDTSNYTTSAALVSGAGEVFSSKRLLTVRPGERGVRQSEALFCHTRDLSAIVGDVLTAYRQSLHPGEIRGVGVSTRPRDEEGSYMPCFLAGRNAAAVAARALNVPLVETSHQEGHLAAAAFGSADAGRPLPEGPFLALHLSGGTGEMLRAVPRKSGYAVERLASFLDITPGQLIDRCGVKLGLGFPAGKELEKLAEQGRCPQAVRPAVKEKGVALSGFENRFDKLLAEGASREDAAAFVFAAVAESVRALLTLAGEEAGTLPVLFSGGVSSSHLLRERLAGENTYFAPPALAADNAVGVALIARHTLTGEA
ncbi:MAG: hypothetical protein J6Z79_07140 [Clostridia bacterium]|nr:hypothetical protein [Clostridia bacterium]